MDFYSSISQIYNHIFPLNKGQVTFVGSLIKGGSDILDIGCGTGNLAIALAEMGFNITAIDTNNNMLDIARSNSENGNPIFRETGMMEIGTEFSDSKFSSVLCFGNTVVHLTDINDIGLFFKGVKEVLVPEGTFLFQIINYDNVLDNKLSQLPTIENSFVRFERNYRLNSSGLIEFETICTIKKENNTLVNTVNLFPLRKSQATELLTQAGFTKIQYFSSFKKDPYRSVSLPLVFVCS